MTDPAHMPPKCCTSKHIPLKHVEHLFSDHFKVKWNKKYQEYTTKDRLYCPVRGCGRWIKSSNITTSSTSGRRSARCSKCKTKVCATCNNKYHRSSTCPRDEETQRFIDTAKEKGWQRCHSCKAMVELKEGCNHMTCRCKAEFCMLCGLEWKTCECPLFNYNHITGNDDRLHHMRVPAVVQVVRRRAGDPRTYHDEQHARRQQKTADEVLARHLQMASLLEPDSDTNTHDYHPTRHNNRLQRPMYAETWGVGNAGTHLMNENFVQNATGFIMAALADGVYGRRGERESSGRRRSRLKSSAIGSGLVPDAFGDESVVGVGPP